jgi:major membrane immunogen (membrane-anchored lipoprotein)
MKKLEVFTCLIILMLLSACAKRDISTKTTKINSLKAFSKSFVPNVIGPLVFISDSSKFIRFEKVSTETIYTEYPTCLCIECECNTYINQESTRLMYSSGSQNISFQLSVVAGDSVDFLTFGMYKMSSDTSEYVYSLRYFDNENPLKLTTDSIANCKFLASKTLNNKVFNNVYVISGKTEENKKFAEEVYYTSKEGIVAYKLNDKSIWTLKQ